MKNELINEVSRIKSMMKINESTLINEITLPGIIKQLMTVLKSEEQLILGKFLKNEIVDEVEKVAFSKFVNSSKGKLFISNLKYRVNNEIFDTLKQKTALSKIAKMEQSAKEWKVTKPFGDDEIILDIKPGKVPPRKGVKTIPDSDSIMDNILSNVGNLNVFNPIEYFKQFLSKGVKDGSINLGRVSIDDAAEDLVRILNPKGLNDEFIKKFQNRTLAQQRMIAKKAIDDLERSIPVKIKTQPWFSKFNQGLNSFSNEGSNFNVTKFAKSFANYYGLAALGTLVYLLNSEQTFPNLDMLKKSIFWPRTFFDNFTKSTTPGTTPNNGERGKYDNL
jgi:hypothetical protein